MAHIWVIDPGAPSLMKCEGVALSRVENYTLPEYSLTIGRDEVFPAA